MPREQLLARGRVSWCRTFGVQQQRRCFSGPRKAGTTNHVDLAEHTRGAVEIAETNATIGEARRLFAVSGVTMKPYFVWFSALCCALTAMAAGPLAAAQTERALLIGINTYQPPGTAAEHPAGCTYGRCELKAFQNLDGSVNDAESMADLLTSAKFGFPANQVALLTNPAPPHPRPGVTILPASQTSHDGILAAMQKYLVDLPQKGDTVVFYDASHGSLRVNNKGNKMTVLVNGKYVHADSTLVPSDAYTGGYDVRDREMTRIFNAAIDKGVHLTVIFDSCHSGGMTRGIGWAILYYDPIAERLTNAWIDEQHLGQLNGLSYIAGIDMWEHAYIYDYSTSEKKKYVDDHMFAEMYVRSDVVKKGKPSLVLRKKLEMKGIDKATLNDVFNENQVEMQEGIEAKIKKDIEQYKSK